ncbi:inosine-uridine nucleoside N-ribohydrolase [Nonomuraea thailandensis]|uniref:Inosine-uridine nucleoside N-ribohydrolase n=1 Tax=Nonomuraea thailandensis TaxID=1188745 RepID=A0A9X2GJN2_9ACTN|nr:nucleoside hydrolase [Nonomuraea thailandensis]MCP2358917.1 inosine-uridine nucleoside N-ribohydrolase [Nonomuraea thailandensis]
MRLHLDTDLGGDPDDLCALAMVLGRPDVTVVGITTCGDPDGRRAGYVEHCLRLAGRQDIPVAAGAGRSSTTGRPMGDLPDHERYWGVPVAPRPAPPEAAIDLLERSIEQGATIAAVGPFTNLALLHAARPGRLDGAPVVAMGGWLGPLGTGLPAWGPEMDWNTQCDPRAAELMAERARLTLVPLPVAARSHLRAAHLPRLAASGPLGELLARQCGAYAADAGMTELGRAHAGLPDDLVNFHWDPVACAVALGWSGAVVQERRVRPVLEGERLRFEDDPGGRLTHVLTDLDVRAFDDVWIEAVERAQR